MDERLEKIIYKGDYEFLKKQIDNKKGIIYLNGGLSLSKTEELYLGTGESINELHNYKVNGSTIKECEHYYGSGITIKTYCTKDKNNKWVIDYGDFFFENISVKSLKFKIERVIKYDEEKNKIIIGDNLKNIGIKNKNGIIDIGDFDKLLNYYDYVGEYKNKKKYPSLNPFDKSLDATLLRLGEISV